MSLSSLKLYWIKQLLSKQIIRQNFIIIIHGCPNCGAGLLFEHKVEIPIKRIYFVCQRQKLTHGVFFIQSSISFQQFPSCQIPECQQPFPYSMHRISNPTKASILSINHLGRPTKMYRILSTQRRARNSTDCSIIKNNFCKRLSLLMGSLSSKN